MGRDQPPHVQKWREVLNHHWPSRPADYVRHEPGIPVRVRIVWEEFGEEYIDGVARRWDAEHVYVEIIDGRHITNGVWVKPLDVYRRSPEPRERDDPKPQRRGSPPGQR